MRAVRGVGCIEKLIDLDVRIEYSSASVYRDTRELSRMFCASVLITFLPHGVYRHGWSRSSSGNIYIYIYNTRTEEQSLLPWILLMNRYMLWQRISKIAKHRDRIAVTLSWFYFLLALGRNRVRKYLAREQYFDPFDPLPVKQFRDLSTYPCFLALWPPPPPKSRLSSPLPKCWRYP